MNIDLLSTNNSINYGENSFNFKCSSGLLALESFEYGLRMIKLYFLAL